MAALKAETRIKKERERLLRILDGADANRLAAVRSLIDRAAFITISLQDIEAQMAETGYVESYSNGEHQSGCKPSALASVHISMTKNLTAVTKQLLDLVPAAQKKSKLAEMMASDE